MTSLDFVNLLNVTKSKVTKYKMCSLKWPSVRDFNKVKVQK